MLAAGLSDSDWWDARKRANTQEQARAAVKGKAVASMTWVGIGWFGMVCAVASLLGWMRATGRHLAEPLPRTLLRPHHCADFTTTTEGDGLPRCYPCYRKEWRRAKFCGEEWPDPDAVFPILLTSRPDFSFRVSSRMRDEKGVEPPLFKHPPENYCTKLRL